MPPPPRKTDISTDDAFISLRVAHKAIPGLLSLMREGERADKVKLTRAIRKVPEWDAQYINITAVMWMFRPKGSDEVIEEAIQSTMQHGPLFISSERFILLCKARPFTTVNQLKITQAGFTALGRAWSSRGLQGETGTNVLVPGGPTADDFTVPSLLNPLTGLVLGNDGVPVTLKVAKAQEAAKRARSSSDDSSEGEAGLRQPVPSVMTVFLQIVWILWDIRQTMLKTPLNVMRDNESSLSHNSDCQTLLRKMQTVVALLLHMSRVSRVTETAKLSLRDLTYNVKDYGVVSIMVSALTDLGNLGRRRPAFYSENTYKGRNVQNVVHLLHEILPDFASMMSVPHAVRLLVRYKMALDPGSLDPLQNTKMLLFTRRSVNHACLPLGARYITEDMMKFRPGPKDAAGWDYDGVRGYAMRYAFANEIVSADLMNSLDDLALVALKNWYGHIPNGNCILTNYATNKRRSMFQKQGVKHTAALPCDLWWTDNALIAAKQDEYIPRIISKLLSKPSRLLWVLD